MDSLLQMKDSGHGRNTLRGTEAMGLRGLGFPCVGAATATATTPQRAEEKGPGGPKHPWPHCELCGLWTQGRAPVGSPAGVAVAPINWEHEVLTPGTEAEHLARRTTVSRVKPNKTDPSCSKGSTRRFTDLQMLRGVFSSKGEQNVQWQLSA